MGDRIAAFWGRGGGFWRAWVVTFIAFVIVGTAWSAAQPVFAGSDEVEHAWESEAVWSGQFVPPLSLALDSQIESGVQHVPVFAFGANCFYQNPLQSAKCDDISLKGAAPAGSVLNYISREPPLPAILTGLPLYLAPNRTGFYLSRLLTSVLGAALLAIAVALACSRRRPVLLVAVLIAATPSFIAELGVLGSSQMEIGSALVLWVCVSLLLTGEQFDLKMGLLVAGSTSLLLLSRPASFVYAAIPLAVFMLCAGRRELRRIISISWIKPLLLAVVLIAAFSLVWLVAVEAPSNSRYMAELHFPVMSGWGARLSFSLSNQMIFWTQMIGATGTNEYSGPAVLTIVWTMLAAGLVIPALISASRRVAVAIGVVLAMLLALPLFAQAYYAPTVYLTWMGRYDTPVFVGLVVLAGSALDTRWNIRETKRLLLLGLSAIAALQVLEFGATLRRYVVGIKGPLSPLSWSAGWRPPLITAFSLFCVGAVIIVAAYGAVWVVSRTVTDVARQREMNQENANATGLEPSGSAGTVVAAASP